jgi:hypothetical protein
MPRALPVLLESAMDSGSFQTYVAIGERTYPGPSYTVLQTRILYYKYDGLELEVKYASPNLPEEDGLLVGEKYYIERGVKVAGVNHTIKSADLRFDDYSVSKQIITAKFSLFSADEKPTAVDGFDTYENVLTDLNPLGANGTASFKETPENPDHWDYIFFPTGKQVNLKSYQSLLPLIRQKYLLQAVDNSDDSNENEVEFYHLRSQQPVSNQWTAQVSPSQDTINPIASMCWAEELGIFVALTNEQTGTDVRAYVSEDGITWSNSDLTGNHYRAIAWSGSLGLFVAIGHTSLATSTNGINWTLRTPVAQIFNAITWAEELGLFMAAGTWYIYSSPDGINWTQRFDQSPFHTFIAIAWSGSIFAVLASTNKIYSSPDGITWTDRTPAVGALVYSGVAWAEELGLFAAFASSSNTSTQLVTSPDGITWTARTTPASNTWRAVAWSPGFGLFTAVADTGSERVIQSTDGITWTEPDVPVSDNEWFTVAFSPSLAVFLIAGYNPEGTAYTLRTLTINFEQDFEITQGDVKIDASGKSVTFLWRDENGTITTEGDAEGVIHNLGYLETTAIPPTDNLNSTTARVIIGIHLKYKSGDIFKLAINADQYTTYHARVIEILDPNAEIGWRNEIELIERFANTNAGAMPSTIERVAAYTPLVTVNFDGNLDATVNNLQAFADRVDDLVITGITQEEIEDFIGAMVTGNTETGIAVTYDDTTGKLNFVAEVTQSELDTVSGAIPTTEQIQDIVGAMFTGNTETGVTVTYQDSDGTIDVEVTGGGGHTIQEEGSSLTARTKLNFVGRAVTATDDSGNDQTDVTISPDMELIETKNVGSDVASVTFSSIPATFTHLKIISSAKCTIAGSSDALVAQFNGDTGSVYDSIISVFRHNATFATAEKIAGANGFMLYATGATANANDFATSECIISDYTNTTRSKSWVTPVFVAAARSTTNIIIYYVGGQWRPASPAAISSIVLFPNNGSNIKTGSVISLYGIKG